MMARRGRQRPGKYLLEPAANRSLSARAMRVMTEAEAEAEEIFRKLRWPKTDGLPVSPRCGCEDFSPLAKQRKFKCAKAG